VSATSGPSTVMIAIEEFATAVDRYVEQVRAAAVSIHPDLGVNRAFARMFADDKQL